MPIGNVLYLFYTTTMPHSAPDPNLVCTAKEAIATAPGWVRLGLTFGDEKLRDEALTILAVTVVERLENPPVPFDPDQLPLAL